MTTINLLFPTKSKENTKNLLRSIQTVSSFEKEKNYSLSIIIFDKTLQQNISSELENFDFKVKVINLSEVQVLEEKHSEFLHSANCSVKVDSIQRARIQQQIYIVENFRHFENSIIWQVDDDMLFGKSEFTKNEHIVNYSTNYFSKIVSLYHQNENIDAIIAPSTYVPPIPSLLYCETQLNDFFNKEYRAQEKVIPLEYHDYYNQSNSENYYSIFLSDTDDRMTIVKDTIIGIPMTKASFESNEVDAYSVPKNEESKLLRGGNFIVFNPEIFKIPHLGFSENNSIPARRSDMIHAHLLSEMRFKIKDVSYFSLVHNRSFDGTTIENCTKKYYSDMIGALLIQYLYKGESEFEKRLEFHQNHIKNILSLLYENVNVNDFQNEIRKLKDLDIRINSFEKEYFIKEFESFKKNKEQLKLKLCKLV